MMLYLALIWPQCIRALRAWESGEREDQAGSEAEKLLKLL